MNSIANTLDEKLVVSFLVGGNLCALDANTIQEVVRVGHITQVHSAPEHILGVMNLRGKIICIIDLATLLKLEKIQIGENTRILIIEQNKELVGYTVDIVLDTLYLDSQHLRNHPGNLGHFAQDFLDCIYEHNGEHLSVLNLSQKL